MGKKNEILDLSFDFALEIIKLVKHLKVNKEFVMSNQLLRSGTSVGANITEAQAAQSPKDFIAKMSIASKEARESNYWLRLLDKSDYFNNYPSCWHSFYKYDGAVSIYHLYSYIKSINININHYIYLYYFKYYFKYL